MSDRCQDLSRTYQKNRQIFSLFFVTFSAVEKKKQKKKHSRIAMYSRHSIPLRLALLAGVQGMSWALGGRLGSGLRHVSGQLQVKSPLADLSFHIKKLIHQYRLTFLYMNNESFHT